MKKAKFFNEEYNDYDEYDLDNNIEENTNHIEEDIEDIEDIEDEDIDHKVINTENNIGNEKDIETIENKVNGNEEPEEFKRYNSVFYYEPDYEDIKYNCNNIWEKYQQKLRKTVEVLAYFKNFDKDELFSQSYIYFVDLCKIYNPYYNNNFIPFNKFLFKNMIIRIKAYIQGYYAKRKREQPQEFSERVFGSSPKNEIIEVEDKLLANHIYGLINDRPGKILELTFKGYKQQEIGEIYDISQSRVSVIKKKAINKLRDYLKDEDL